MADIALLVAEEYERRVRISRTKVQGAEKQDIDLVCGVAVLAERIKTRIIGHQRIEAVHFAFEPKTQIAVAAFNGAFSA